MSPTIFGAKKQNPPTTFQLSNLSLAEKIIYWTIALTPLWWLLGIQTLFYPAVVIVLLAISCDLDKLIRTPVPISVWLWLIMALTMLWTAMLGLGNLGFNFAKFAAVLVTFFKGYFLIFACLLLPFTTRIRVQVITRAVAWMAVSYLVVITIQLILLYTGIYPRYSPLGIGPKPVPSIISFLSPGNKSLSIRLNAFLTPFFGLILPRSWLYMPDPPIPGIAGCLSFLICLNESNPRLRKFSLAGSLSALLISHSRLAFICLPLAILIKFSFRSPFARQISLWLFSLAALLSSLLEVTISELVLNKPLEIFHSARPSSSKDRAFVVSETLKAWQESPWLGWGVAQGEAQWHTYGVTLGSFSTYTGVLYLHGIVGLTVFLATIICTLASFWQPAVEGNDLCKQGFASLVALYLFIHGLPLSWIAVYIWFFFMWIGAILAQTQREPISKKDWNKLTFS